MSDNDVKVFNPREKVWPRGWQATLAWLRSHRIARVLVLILPAAAAAFVVIRYQNGSPVRAAIYGVAAGLTGSVLLFFISLIGNLISVLKHQIDEARGEVARVSAALQLRSDILNAGIKELIDLEFTHKALVATYQPIKELAAFKSGDIVKGKQFNVSLMFNQMNTSVISNITFENCTFLGPNVISFLGSAGEITGTSFSGNLENVVVKADAGKGYLGMCAFLNCKIRNCKFVNVGIIGDDVLKEQLKNQTTNK
jgi:hypothetical protein